jgi:alkylhydroperoxidase/carboxymuconolactone decarboxylase family protein YurZ
LTHFEGGAVEKSPAWGDADRRNDHHDRDRGDGMLQPAYPHLLLRLALSDERAVQQVIQGSLSDVPPLDGRAATLVCLACLVASDCHGPALSAGIERCYAAGIERAEMVRMVEAVSPEIGCDRMHRALSTIAATDETSA